VTYLDVMAGLWTRATGTAGGDAAELKVSLPDARGWLTSGKRPRAVWEERDERTGAWVAKPLHAFWWRTREEVQLVLNTRGWSQVAGVESIRFTWGGLVVRMRDGRAIEVFEGAAPGRGEG